MRKTPNGLLYDKRIAAGINQTFDLISDVFDEYENAKWTTRRYGEYGFYDRSKETKCEIFFGVWFNLWEFFEIPVCICIDYYGTGKTAKHHQIKKWVEEKNISGIVFKDYEMYAIILFDESFFNFDESDITRCVDIVRNLSIYLTMMYSKENPKKAPVS